VGDPEPVGGVYKRTDVHQSPKFWERGGPNPHGALPCKQKRSMRRTWSRKQKEYGVESSEQIAILDRKNFGGRGAEKDNQRESEIRPVIVPSTTQGGDQVQSWKKRVSFKLQKKGNKFDIERTLKSREKDPRRPGKKKKKKKNRQCADKAGATRARPSNLFKKCSGANRYAA